MYKRQEEYQQRLESGDFDCAIAALNGDYNSPYAILSQFSSNSGKNVSGYQNADFDRLLAEAVQHPDEKDVYKRQRYRKRFSRCGRRRRPSLTPSRKT